MSENWPYWQWPYRHHLTLYAEPTNEKNKTGMKTLKTRAKETTMGQRENLSQDTNTRSGRA